MASTSSRVGRDSRKIAVLLRLTLHRGALLTTNLSKKSYTEAPRDVSGGANSQTSGSHSLYCGKSGGSYNDGGTHRMAFLPRPCVTEEQLADLSNYPHSPTYFQGSENPGANSESPTELCGVPPSIPTQQQASSNFQWTNVGPQNQEILM